MKVLEFPRHSVRLTSEEVSAMIACIDLALTTDITHAFQGLVSVALNLRYKLEPYLGEIN